VLPFRWCEGELRLRVVAVIDPNKFRFENGK
jgi:hypothetical protein